MMSVIWITNSDGTWIKCINILRTHSEIISFYGIIGRLFLLCFKMGLRDFHCLFCTHNVSFCFLYFCILSSLSDLFFVCMSFVSLNADSTRLLVGHIRGQIVMWDMTCGKVLRTITNVHLSGVAVFRICFTDDRTLAISNDSAGSVFLLEFKRLIGVRTCDFQCLFSGSRGEVHFTFLHFLL